MNKEHKNRSTAPGYNGSLACHSSPQAEQGNRKLLTTTAAPGRLAKTSASDRLCYGCMLGKQSSFRVRYFCVKCSVTYANHDRALDPDFLVCIEDNPGPPKKAEAVAPPATRKKKGGRKAKQGAVASSLAREVDRLRGELDAQRDKVVETVSMTEVEPPRDPRVDETKRLRAEIDLRRAKRDLAGDIAKYGMAPFGSGNGDGDPPIVESLTSGDIFQLLIDQELFNARPVVVIAEVPRADYAELLPSNFGEHTGFLSSVVSWWRDEDYPLVRDVFYVGVFAAVVNVPDTRPMDDREEVLRDYSFFVVQPAVRIRLHDGSVHYSVTSKWPQKWLEGFTLGAWFPPAPSDFVATSPHPRFPLETVPMLNPADQYILSDFMIGDVAVKMQPFYVSCYALQNFYQRRTLLTPQLDQTTAVKRMVRMYSEDPVVNSFLDIKLLTGRCVMTDTLNFLVTLAFGDLESPLQSF